MPAEAQSAASASFATGLPVELGKIERELKKLWDEGGAVMTRASLINLAVYSEAPDSLRTNTQLVAEITREHACRAIVIGANPALRDEGVEAWISAHCHVTRAGSKQICSEQISFSLTGPTCQLLPSIVFSHLDSDLPFYLWWQGEFHEPIDPQLWSWVDRVIYDSQQWSDFEMQLRLVETAQRDAKQRIVLCDLNWARLVQMRLAIAQFFDAPATHECLMNMRQVEIAYAPEFRSTALLLVGWLGAQLGWTLIEAADETTLSFADSAGEAIRVSLQEEEGEPIGRCTLSCGETEFRVVHRSGADLLEVAVHAGGAQRLHQLMPAGHNDPVSLMSEELMRGGPHRVYLRALNVVRELL
ncbi:MAG TPA: glucose-6-phosphate dehydrogenase assembly protein OpcA [Chthoniobacterales bacterium]